MRREHAKSIGPHAGAGATSRTARRAGVAILAAGLVAAGATACNDTTAAGVSGGDHSAAKAKSAAGTSATKDGVRTDGEPGVPMCTADDLKVHLGRPSPAAGNIYVPLVFTNTGDRTCELKGYPGVSLLDDSREMIGRPAHEVTAARHYVNLAPGKSGRVTLHTLNRGVSGTSCWQPATDLRAYPPGSKASIVVPAHGLRICGGTFDVGVMRPGTGA